MNKCVDCINFKTLLLDTYNIDRHPAFKTITVMKKLKRQYPLEVRIFWCARNMLNRDVYVECNKAIDFKGCRYFDIPVPINDNTAELIGNIIGKKLHITKGVSRGKTHNGSGK